MALSISKCFDFSASHVLEGMPPGHKCARLHGHTYRVRVELWGDVDDNGLIMDFGDLDWVGEFVLARLDHRHLNDVVSFNPTSELVSQCLAEQIGEWLETRPESARIHEFAVSISEGRTSWATMHQIRPA